VVDWVALSCYGAQSPTEAEWGDFRRLMDEYVPRVEAVAPGMPIVVAELGADVRNPHGDASRWSEDAVAALLGARWPAVRGFSWWSERWANDGDPAHDSEMRVTASPALAAALRRRMATPALLERPIEN
jgi:predicted NAD-dependent protein-ADP-ribosyltransferase YbiA (DUF1768 family)